MTDHEPHCLYVMFSDHVIREAGTGKLSLIGMFSSMNLLQFPAVTPPFFITVGLDNFHGPLAQLKLTVRLEDQKTGHVLSSNITEINSTAPFTRDMLVEIPMQLAPCQIHTPGTYHVVVLVDNEQVAERKFPVMPVPASHRPPAGPGFKAPDTGS